MKKIIYLLLAIVTVLAISGCEANGRYRLSSKMTGTLGSVSASTVEKGGKYAINLSVSTSGMYNLLKGKRTEKYSSKGRVVKGRYYSDLFIVERWKNRENWHDKKTYKFDYKRKKITLHYQVWTKGKKTEDSTKKLKFFTHNDYLNVIPNALKANKSKRYLVAGSEETNGKVPVYISHDKGLIKRWGGSKNVDTLVQMGAYKGIFKNHKGNLTLLLGKNKQLEKLLITNLKTINTIVVVKK